MVSESGSDQSEDPTAGSGSSPRARVFVALKIAPGIADELARMALELERFPVRLIAPADIHLTLVPPWNEVSIPGAVGKLRGVAGRFGEFVLEFRHVGYGPDPRRPRFLWVECAAGPDLAQLRASLLVAFEQTDERPFRPHVTLARLRANGTHHRAEMSDRSGACADATHWFGRASAIASSGRKRLQTACVAPVRHGSGTSKGAERCLAARWPRRFICRHSRRLDDQHGNSSRR